MAAMTNGVNSMANGRGGQVMNGRHHHGPMIDDPDPMNEGVDAPEADDELSSATAGLSAANGLLPTNMKDQRVKRRAKRPSKQVPTRALEALDVASGEAGANGIWRPSHPLANGVVKKAAKNSRRPRGRFGRGLVKKGGAGGKGTWGKLGSELDAEDELEDPCDPNYDSDSQDNCRIKLEAITPPLDPDELEFHVKPIIHEYFEHGDTEEVAELLEELNLGDLRHQVLVLAISLAMERKGSCREMTSQLISDLYNRVMSEEDMERGFNALLNNLGDLVLDTPTAPTVLGNFIARSVADDCIPPKFVQVLKMTVRADEAPLAAACVEHADTLLSMKHGLVKLDSVWGVTGGMRPVKYLIKQMKSLLKEYLSSGDKVEATRCLQELEVPHFHHELVYEAVVMALEDMKDHTLDLMCDFLKWLAESVIVTLDQLNNGFNRVYDEMAEIAIDVPLAYVILDKFVNKCENRAFLPKELIQNAPSKGRKRFVSEGDGGLFKE